MRAQLSVLLVLGAEACRHEPDFRHEPAAPAALSSPSSGAAAPSGSGIAGLSSAGVPPPLPLTGQPASASRVADGAGGAGLETGQSASASRVADGAGGAGLVLGGVPPPLPLTGQSPRTRAFALERPKGADPVGGYRGSRRSLATGGAHVVESRFGMVSSVETRATEAGVHVLERGGNAVDAAVAVGFALAVTHPNAGNLGGGGFMLVRPRGGPTVAIDFREKSPRAVTAEAFRKMLAGGAMGPASVAVPGTVAGLDLALARFGRLSRADVMKDAIRLAKSGHELGTYQAKTLGWAWAALSRDPVLLRVYGDRGKPKKEGASVVQPELAAVLERIAERGDAGFYEGETAAAIEALAPRGGLVTREDLAQYRAVIREPLRTTYRGFVVEVAPPPSAGGVAVVSMLGLLERLEPTPLPLLSSPEVHLFAEIARRAHAVRRFEVGDPDSFPGWDDAALRTRWLDVDGLIAGAPPVDPEHATPSKAVSPLFDAAMRELEHTTHFSVADAEGTVVSCTTTLSSSFGAKVSAAGVILNDSLAAFGTVGKNVLAPERRMTSSMSPTIVRDGEAPVLVLGSPGGDTIPNTVVRVLRSVLDYGLTIDRAVDAPRIHHGFVPDEIRYESGHPPAASVLRELRRRGHRTAAPTRAIGDANVVLLWDGVFYGYADPREGGRALGPAGVHAVPAGSGVGRAPAK